MKRTVVWLIILVILFLFVKYTVEGVENKASNLVNISENPYSFSYIRPVTYNYKYKFNPIINATSTQTTFDLPPADIPSKVNLHVAIIVPENITDIQIGTLKSRIEATSFKESIKAFTMIKTPDDFSKFIYDMNITDANIIMNVYDLLEMGYSQKGTKPIVLSVLQYKEIPQGLASGEKYIQRAINIPFINTTL